MSKVMNLLTDAGLDVLVNELVSTSRLTDGQVDDVANEYLEITQSNAGQLDILSNYEVYARSIRCCR